MVMRGIFVHERKEIIVTWRKLTNDEVFNI